MDAVHWFGAYDIVVGEVESAAVRSDGQALLFGDRAFLSATRLEAVS